MVEAGHYAPHVKHVYSGICLVIKGSIHIQPKGKREDYRLSGRSTACNISIRACLIFVSPVGTQQRSAAQESIADIGTY